MKIQMISLGYLLCLMVYLVAARPGYNIQGVTGGQALPNFVSHLGGPSLNQGLFRSTNLGANQLQIVPSAPVSQAYLPPLSAARQTFTDVSQLPLQAQTAAGLLPVAPVHLGHSQNFINRPTILNQQVLHPHQRTIVTKDIFIHTAPPEADNDVILPSQLGSIPARKNYRIIFIKAPTENVRITAEAVRQAQAANEERTIIYVLSKKTDVVEIQKQLNQVQDTTISHKPEVFFIKYKTNEEAQRAQQQIQAQYDALGGSTSISDEGVAPVSSVIGALNNNIESSGGGQLGSIATSNRGYLPPIKK